MLTCGISLPAKLSRPVQIPQCGEAAKLRGAYRGRPVTLDHVRIAAMKGVLWSGTRRIEEIGLALYRQLHDLGKASLLKQCHRALWSEACAETGTALRQ
jgi:hypothetical protein